MSAKRAGLMKIGTIRKMSGLLASMRASGVEYGGMLMEDVGDRPGAGRGPAQTERAHAMRRATFAELAASIAHEVNQPLAAIVTNGETCLRWMDRGQPNLDKARASVAAMIRDAQRASHVIRLLHALSTNTDIKKSELDLNEVIEEVIPLIDREVRRNRVSLRLDLATEPLSAYGDRVQLQQVITNLLVNGIQAMAAVSDRTRELFIRSEKQKDDQVVVVVRDSGAGIEADDADQLFDAFFTTKADGMGMGLWICRSIIEAHGGRIWASSNCGPGASFHFALPAS